LFRCKRTTSFSASNNLWLFYLWFFYLTIEQTPPQEGNVIQVTLNEPSLHQKGAYVALKLSYMYKPDLGFGALHEVLDGRNEAINNFYSQVCHDYSSEA
jgi:hypothetical protein